MKTLWIRFWAATPPFWIKVQKNATAIGTVLVAIWVAHTQLGLELPADIQSIIKYGIVSCIVITGTAQFTKIDVK